MANNIKKSITWRVVFGMGVVVLFAFWVSFQMFRIQLVEGNKWLVMSDSITIRHQDISPARGNIYSDNGSLLSTSMPIYEIRWDATVVNDDTFHFYVNELAQQLARLFPDKTSLYYKSKLNTAKKSKSRYVLIRRKVNYHEQKTMRDFPIFRKGRYRGGFMAELNTKRVKPAGNLAFRTIGYRTKDNLGVGLERTYNDDLGGVKGKRLVQKISGGYRPLNDENLIEPKNGRDIHTTINIDFQEIAQRSLEKSLIKHKADHGCVIVMKVSTGEIKAISNLSKREEGVYSEQYNYSIGESYEPGSVWKVFSAMAAFEDELISPNDSMDIQNGVREYFGKKMQDSDKGRFKKMSFKQAFARSSNVAFSSVIFDNYSSKPSNYISYLKKLDLDKPTGIEILGEPDPFLNHPASSSWSQLTLPWLAIGYENQHTPLQLLTAYNGIINDGIMIRPQIVSSVTDAGIIIKENNNSNKTVRVCSEETSKKIKELTAEVFISGSARNVRSDVVTMGGKTGTAQIASSSGYQKAKMYNASFVGHFPAMKPEYSIYVMVNKPSNGIFYASYVAAPVFSEVAKKIFTISVKKEVVDSLIYKPNYHAGFFKDIKIINNQLGYIMDENSSADFVRVNSNNSMTEDVVVEEGKMPDFRNFGVKDAVYVSELLGLKPIVAGRGRVVEQSPKPGAVIHKSQTVYIRLN
ncbi:MAG: penicillin-binding protein [Bacteroidia bacterium]|nr:penicillin-binding protein [Bacteroidia bacterium]|tara:strand:+ start:14004 stop:16076 length:2073 start_codon:yes stop_codon:yes gene_type:complete